MNSKHDPEKYRLLQAQRLIDQFAGHKDKDFGVKAKLNRPISKKSVLAAKNAIRKLRQTGNTQRRVVVVKVEQVKQGPHVAHVQLVRRDGG